jgi:uncharacterized protein YgiM (DUF1202 family)
MQRAAAKHRVGIVAVLLGLVALSILGLTTGRVLATIGPEAQPLQQSSTGKLAVVGAQAADLYDAPGGTVAQSLAPGTTLTAVGRSADNQWILVTLDDGTPGWIETNQLVVFGTDQLPVMTDEGAAPATPAATAVSTRSATTATGTTTVEATAPVTDTQETSEAATEAEATEPPATPTNTRPAPTATPTNTPSPEPSPTPLPTNTPSPSPSPTPLPTETPTPVLLGVTRTDVIAVVGADGADLVESPTGEAVETLAVGTALTAQGRSGDGLWLYVQTTDGAAGWVETANVVVFNVRGLPVMDESAATQAEPASDEPNPTAVPSAESNGTPNATAIPDETREGMDTADVDAEIDAAATATAPPPTATRRPIPEADGRPTAQVAMTGSRLNIRSGPGTEYAIVGKALPDEVFIAIGRNGPATWVQLEVAEAPEEFGWVSVQFVELSEPVVNLPISDQTSSAPVQPSATSIPTATSETPAIDGTPVSTAPAPETTPAVQSASTQPVAQNTGPTGLSGKLVIQSVAGGTFYLYDLASGSLRPLTGGFDPALSPDGTQIVFTRLGGQNGVYLINADGSNERKIFGEREGLRSPKWSPDGKWIVFSRADGTYDCRDLGFAGLCVSEDEIFPKPRRPGEDASPEEQAEYDAIRGIRANIINEFDRITRGNWMISRIDTNGNEYRDLAALNSALAPDWSSAGIVYQSTGGLQKTADNADAETRRIIDQPYYHDPDWQPGGGRIVFQAQQGPHWEIFAVNPDGTGLVALTRPQTALVDKMPSNVAPAWSPDGQQIVFLSNREEDGEAGKWRVWVMNADGSNQRPLPVDLPIEYGYVSEQMVDWGK